MAYFYFAIINTEAKTLFLEEMKLRFPDLKLSFSENNFYTFKSEKTTDFTPFMSRLSGQCIGKLKENEWDQDKVWFYSVHDLSKNKAEAPFKIFSEIKLVVETSKNQYWDCRYLLLPSHLQTPGEVSSVLQHDSPSRAYQKIAEAFDSMDFSLGEDQIAVEFGSAPGGASQYLLESGANVIGIDPAEMDTSVLNSKKFKHIKLPFEKVNSNHLPSEVQLLACDINLPPTVVIKEVKRILSFCRPQEMMLTLKINEKKHLQELPYWRKEFLEFGFSQVVIKYLPSYKQEICLLARL